MRPCTFLGFLLLLSGCASREPSPVRLTLISPHRDEIREEVGLAFPAWFHERTAARLDASRLALRDWLDTPGDAQRHAVEQACRSLLDDWQEEDLPDLFAAHRAWTRQPDEATARALLQAAEQVEGRQPRVQLAWQDVGGGTSAIARYIGARFQANPQGIGIDVLFGGGTDIFVRFAEQGLLEPIDLPAPLLTRIRPQLHGVPLYDPRGRWFGPMLSSFGILYNREVLRRRGDLAPPRRWEDLGRPELSGWVSGGDPRLSGSIHMVYEIILQGRGWDDGFGLLLRLGANAHSFIRDSGTLTRMVTSGEVAAAGNLDANALSAVGREPEIMGFVLPEVETIRRPAGSESRAGGTIINPDAVAVLQGAPRRQLARAFVEYLLSDAGQLLFLLRPGQPGGPRRHALCRLSVVEELYQRHPAAERSVGDANPFANPNVLQYQAGLSNRRWDALNDLFGAVIIDAHPDLRAAWLAVLPLLQARDEDFRGRILAAGLFRPPCTEDELLAHAQVIANGDRRERARQVNAWGEQARERYRDIQRRARE